MQGLNMDFELTVPVMLRRAEQLFGPREIVTRLPDKSLHRYTYADFIPRARRLGAALTALGMGRGDRVGTLAWNHYQHLEAYFGIPAFGGVTHTLNLRLHPTDLGYIAKHGGDKLLIVDESLLPLCDRASSARPTSSSVIVDRRRRRTGCSRLRGAHRRHATTPVRVSGARRARGRGHVLHVRDDRATRRACSTRTARSVLHTLVAVRVGRALDLARPTRCCRSCRCSTPTPGASRSAARWSAPSWCSPARTSTRRACSSCFQDERVTITGGVPTIWLGILQLLDAKPEAYDLSSVQSMVVGGSAAPALADRGGFRSATVSHVLHAWGMTEMAPLGTIAQLPPRPAGRVGRRRRYAYRAKQGRPVAARRDPRPRRGRRSCRGTAQTMGELEVRGPWIASSLLRRAEARGPLHQRRLVQDRRRRHDRRATATSQIQDRSKDLIKSGGEWISSVALENALMGHPAVAEAAVIAVPHRSGASGPWPRSSSRRARSATGEELREHLAAQLRQVPAAGRFEFVDEIPKTAVGKFKKTALREQFAHEQTPASG